MPLLSREQLYSMVWADPVRTIAASLGCSDASLKKACAAAGIPVPDRGHWAKLRAKKAVIIRKLPPREPGVSETVAVGKIPYRSSWPPNPERDLAEPPPVAPAFPEAIEDVRTRIERSIPKAKFQRDLSSPHHLIRHLLEEDEKRRSKPEGIPYRLRYSEPKFGSPFERRRLRILNSVFLGLAKAGHKGWIADEDARQIGVVIGGEQVSFTLDHPKAKADREGRFRARATGVEPLRLAISGTELNWTDTSQRPLEDCLSEIVVELILSGERQYRAGEVRHYDYECKHRLEMEELLIQRREEAERLDRESRLKAEKGRRRLLLRMSRDLKRAEEIRTLVAKVVQRYENADATQIGNIQAWASRALAVAARTDPLDRIRFQKDGLLYLEEVALPPDRPTNN